jgi:lysyl-tRNA synthetase, class II
MKKIALVLLSLMILTAAAFAVDLLPVDSSLIAKAGYDATTQVLSIQMVNSSDVYNYQAVPQAVYDSFLAAESKGAFYVKSIKGQYKTDKAPVAE